MADADAPVWKQFEHAVAAFLQALDPDAKITHNKKTPDAHSGEPRQYDVWIEKRLFGFVPIRIIVSCKYESRPLDQGHITTFHGEVLAAEAHQGVIYSKSGFTENALAKAKGLDFCCCSLYENRPPDLPESLFLRAYCSRNRVALGLLRPLDEALGFKTWSDLFACEVIHNEKAKPLIDAIVEIHDAGIDESQGKVSSQCIFPPEWELTCELPFADEPRRMLHLRVYGSWKTWEAKTEAYLLNGTYSFTNNLFVGSQSTPVIDTWGVDPGSGWTLIDQPKAVPAGNCHCIIKGQTKESLLAGLGSTNLPNGRGDA